MLRSHWLKAFEEPSRRRYWLAYSLSALGFELVSFALMVLLFEVTNTAVSMGAFTSIYLSCLVIFGPLAGTYIDRWNRKRIFIGSNLSLALVVSLLTVLVGPFWIYVAWFLASLVFVFLRSARVALITNLFLEEDYVQANAAFMVSLNFSKIGGPLIGGMLLLYFPRQWAVTVILTCFFISSLLVFRIPFQRSPVNAVRQKRPPRSWKNLAAGIRFILSHERLRFYISIGFFWRFFLASQLPLYIVFVKDYLDGGTSEYSVFMTILSAGGAAGSLLAGGMGNRLSRNTMIYTGLGVSYLLFSLMPLFHSYSTALVLIGLSNLFFFFAHVAIHSDIQRVTPDEIRGIVFASSPALLIPVGLLSILIATSIADRVGVQWVFIVTGLLALFTLPLPAYGNRVLSKDTRNTVLRAEASE